MTTTSKLTTPTLPSVPTNPKQHPSPPPSTIYKGYAGNGRKYQVTREGEYWEPSDEKQWEAMQAAHLVYLILDSKGESPLFRSPVEEKAQHILDFRTGDRA